MPNLSIKNVPAPVVEKLHARAAANHRSLQGELMALICQAAEGRPAASTARPVGGQRKGARRIEEVAAEHRARRPQPVEQGASAVELIRADRDAR